MEGIGYVSALMLALVFVWAAIAKLYDRQGTVRSFAALGLPPSSGVALAVPVSELLVAAALVSVPWVGGFAALVTLAAFTALLGARLMEGADVSCGCFGTSSHQRISFVEIVRNAVLAGLALAALAADQPVRPSLAELVTATTGAAIGAAVVALATVKRDTGSVWRTTLAGELRRSRR